MGNDLDAVAMATPAYGAPYSRHLDIPSTLAAGDYAVWVEVNKEFDSNSAHNGTTHPSVFDAGLASYGMSGNFGQPSVVYRAPIRLDDVTSNATGTADQILGYSDWTGATGTMMPPDATITTGVPGRARGGYGNLGPRRHRPPAGLLVSCSPVSATRRRPRRGWYRI